MKPQAHFIKKKYFLLLLLLRLSLQFLQFKLVLCMSTVSIVIRYFPCNNLPSRMNGFSNISIKKYESVNTITSKPSVLINCNREREREKSGDQISKINKIPSFGQ